MSEIIPNKLLTSVLSQFGYAQEDCNISSLGNGLINNTYLVHTGDKSFVLQRINQQVFNAPLNVINNADLISAHLNVKSAQQLYPLTPIWQLRGQGNKSHVKVQEQYWRCLHYIDHCYTLESISSPEQASDVANAFAQFAAALSDFDSKSLAEIIPQFHDLTLRIKQLHQAIEQTTDTLHQQAQATIAFILSQQDFIDDISEITKQLPLRVTHNDTKINNLLFSKVTNKPIAVIDLDTCMEGYLMHDFGDMVRTCCVSIAEDSVELDSMSIDFEMLKALSNAYIAGFNGSITKVEQASLLLGIKLMPFMLSIRFLTDFLMGDVYFKVNYPSHNLIRAQNQLHLYKLFCENEALLLEIV